MTPEGALAASRLVFTELGWEILEEDDTHLVAMEFPFRLSCLARPADAEVAVRPESSGPTTVTLVGASRGVGAGPQLEAQMNSIEKRILALVS